MMRSAIRNYLWTVAVACGCAAGLAIWGGSGPLHILKHVPLLPATLSASVLGLPLLIVVNRRLFASRTPEPIRLAALGPLIVLGALLAVPPVLLDLAFGFPPNINVLPPQGLLFYPAIALVAEVVFHLFPLALLALVLPRGLSPVWWIAPVVVVEPLFQAVFVKGPLLLKFLVICNVGLVSITQFWLFWRYGFAAMIGLRLAYYLFWHIIWGGARLSLLY